MVVMFVDLVGSTEYKAVHPAEEQWLPRLAQFLIGVTRIVEMHGRVVKYIGDEVMAAFEGDGAPLNAEHAAESILAFCEQLEGENLQVKIALDYGDVSLLNFASEDRAEGTDGRPALHSLDPQGLVVDRCARLMSKASAGAVLCSAAFQGASRTPQRWGPIGEFRPKGFTDPISVFLLQTKGAPTLNVEDEKMTLAECKKEVEKLQVQLAEAKRLIKR
jgi:class 3 adenylate cyclase